MDTDAADIVHDGKVPKTNKRQIDIAKSDERKRKASFDETMASCEVQGPSKKPKPAHDPFAAAKKYLHR